MSARYVNHGRCPECGDPIHTPTDAIRGKRSDAQTCGPKCAKRRQRRLAREREHQEGAADTLERRLTFEQRKQVKLLRDQKRREQLAVTAHVERQIERMWAA